MKAVRAPGLTLRAVRAARWFVRRRAAAVHRSPLALTWRRPRTGHVATSSAGVRATIGLTFVTHLSPVRLDLTLQRNLVQRGASRIGWRESPRECRHRDRHTRIERVGHTTTTLHAPKSTTVSASHLSFLRASSQRASLRSMSRDAQRVVTAAVMGRARMTARKTLSPPSGGRERIIDMHNPLAHRNGAPNVQAIPEHRAVSAELRRVPELTYRAPNARADRVPEQAQPSSGMRWQATAHAAAATAPGVQAVVEQARRETPRQAPALEPAFVERVADDVLRRIDQRLRIERERRGL